MKRLLSPTSSVLLSAIALFTGCAIAPTSSERQAREQVAQIESAYRPRGAKPPLPELSSASTLADYLRFGLLNHPQIEAAYHEWRASVAAIAPARALPDPQLTFEADIADTLMTFMPGVMFDFMAPGKRTVMADEAAAKSGVAYRAYVTAVLRTAANIQKAWIDLAYVSEGLRIYEATLANIDQSMALAGAEFSTNRGMVSFDQMMRLKNLAGEHHTHHAVLSERLIATRARFKSALGLGRAASDPAWPQPKLMATALPSEDELWRSVLAANPELATMRAMVEMAVAEIAVAQKARTPDFALGAMADLKASPLMVRPEASVTLPVWREKIAANIAAAQARRDAATARVNAEQLNLAAELAQMLFMVREADRMIAYIEDAALPNFERALSSAQAGYLSGMGNATMIADTRHMALNMELERVKMLRERELAVADILVLLAGQAPAGAPLLAQTEAGDSK